MWLRDSSFVAVRHVHITGVHGAEAIEIRSALDDAAKRMSTMDFNARALRSAVASFAIVGAMRVKTELPHTVSIAVTERPPVAALQSAGQRTAVAADGTVLGPAWLSSALPLVSCTVEPSAGARLRAGFALEAVTVLGAAPPALAKHVARVYNGPEGLTVSMGNGLLVYFGNATRPHAKWMSLARVLASPSEAGALYVDVRLPERPAAGFTTLTTPSPSSSSAASAESTTGASAATSADPTAVALARRLSEAAGGEAVGSPATTSPSQESEEASSGSNDPVPLTRSGESEASATGGSAGVAGSSAGASEAGGASEGHATSASPATASPTGGEAAPGG